MKIQNQIEVDAPPDRLFELLADPERVAPCMPGASLKGREDDAYEGTVRLKVGPITASYRGTLRFVELDHESRRAVMKASGQETNGQGNAEATITASVSGSDSRSVLSMETDLEVRGKAAQFGRGVLGNVSQRLLDQFARNLESQVLSGTEQQPSGEVAAEADEAPAAARDSLDVFSVVGTPRLRQVAPAVGGLVLGFLLGSYLSSRKTLRAYEEAMRLMSYAQFHGPPRGRWPGG
jgi:uncharacterized protein